jgi:hypothetical protein
LGADPVEALGETAFEFKGGSLSGNLLPSVFSLNTGRHGDRFPEMSTTKSSLSPR